MSKYALSETLHQLIHTYTNLLLEGVKRQELDLSVTHIRTLKGVCQNPEVTAKSIAQRMQRDKAQVTRALNDLLVADLIVKKDNPLDGRSQLLQPTAKGKAVMAKLNAAEEWTREQLTQHLTEAELNAFLQVSKTMINNVKNSQS
ncbi:MAG: MarR family winged helix-turn-helix transcriptional regulator [Psychrobacter sp.]|uniref:MarR family winged helix-turn-helix transcriptional regulator n=1 Tax=unclassified Psychrobacter TaxID=196806 RepID=UPI001788576F|nr:MULTISPECIES: MarR family winged helix-turn-helix transcriptional regulator [unclassified Psychrobacter]MBE0442732.1 winged helix-turn-helix transcriptional regulator [Psychrobacter sp. FME13]